MNCKCTVHPFFVLRNSVDKKIGAANDYHPFNLQLTEQRSWLITSYNVHQPVLQALRYVGCTGRMVLSANVSTSSVQPNNKYNPQKASLVFDYEVISPGRLSLYPWFNFGPRARPSNSPVWLQNDPAQVRWGREGTEFWKVWEDGDILQVQIIRDYLTQLQIPQNTPTGADRYVWLSRCCGFVYWRIKLQCVSVCVRAERKTAMETNMPPLRFWNPVL